MRAAQYFGKLAKKNNTKARFHSVFVSGMLRMGFKEKDLKNVESNVGVSYALYDEGAWQNELKHGSLENAPEILRLINLHSEKENKINKVEMGKYYGSLNNNSATIIFNEKLLHPFQPYAKEAISNQISYFLDVFQMGYLFARGKSNMVLERNLDIYLFGLWSGLDYPIFQNSHWVALLSGIKKSYSKSISNSNWKGTNIVLEYFVPKYFHCMFFFYTTL